MAPGSELGSCAPLNHENASRLRNTTHGPWLEDAAEAKNRKTLQAVGPRGLGLRAV